MRLLFRPQEKPGMPGLSNYKMLFTGAYLPESSSVQWNEPVFSTFSP